MSGKFIVVGGGEGAGKTTILQMLETDISLEGRDVLFTREPGGTEFGEKIRSLILSKDSSGIGSMSEMFAFFAARAALVEGPIRKARENGIDAVCDRYMEATFAYQAYWLFDRTLSPVTQMFRAIWTSLSYEYRPDLTIILDLPPEVGLRRRMEAGDVNRFDEADMSSHKRVREGHLVYANQYPPCVVINANRSFDEVYTDVKEIVYKTIGISGSAGQSAGQSV